MRRAQIAVEYLSLIALSLAVLLPLWVYVDGEAARFPRFAPQWAA